VCIGREIIVGLSGRTNMLGAQAVAKAFPEYPTTIVRVTPPAVHLKDYISMAGPEVMAIGRSEAAQQTFLVLASASVYQLVQNSIQFSSITNLYSVVCRERIRDVITVIAVDL